MLAIILLILKIIGIILLSILGLCIFLVLLVLFVPIRYRASGQRQGGADDPPLEAKAKVTWLLHILSITVEYLDKPVVKIKVFGITIKSKSDKEKSEEMESGDNKSGKKREKADSDEGDEFQEEPLDLPTGEVVPQDTSETNPLDEDVPEQDETTASDDAVPDQDETSTKDDAAPSEEFAGDPDENVEETEQRSSRSNLVEQIRNIPYKIKTFYDNIANKVEEFRDQKIRQSKIARYIAIYQDDRFQKAFSIYWPKLIKHIRAILPRKGKVDFEVGFEDPGLTGYILALYSMMIPLLGKQIHVRALFDENVIRGTFFFRGKFRLFEILIDLVRIKFDKNLKYVREELRK